MGKLYETTIALNAQLTSGYKSTFANAIKTQRDWDDALVETQEKARQMSGLENLGNAINNLKEEMAQAGTASQEQIGRLDYLQGEYNKAAAALDMVGASQEEVAAAAAKLNSEFEEQAVKAMDAKQAEASLKDTTGVVTLREEVERLTKAWEKNRSPELEKDLLRQQKALAALEKRTGLATRKTEELTKRQALLNKQLRMQNIKKTLTMPLSELAGNVAPRVSKAFTAISKGAAIATAAVGAIGVAGKKMMDLTGETAGKLQRITDLSWQFGTSTKNLQELDYAMRRSGIDSNQFADGLKTLQQKIEEARQGGAGALNSFKRLGISIEDLKTKKVDEVFTQMAGNIHMLQDESAKTKIGLELLGGSGARMAAILSKEGKAGLEALRLEAVQTGAVLDEGAFKTAEAYLASSRQVEAGFEALKTELGVKYMPFISDALQTSLMMVKDWGAAFETAGKQWVKWGKQYLNWISEGGVVGDALHAVTGKEDLGIKKGIDYLFLGGWQKEAIGALEGAFTGKSAGNNDNSVTVKVEQKIDLSNISGTGDIESLVKRGASTGGNDLAEQLTAIIEQQQRLAY